MDPRCSAHCSVALLCGANRMDVERRWTLRFFQNGLNALTACFGMTSLAVVHAPTFDCRLNNVPVSASKRPNCLERGDHACPHRLQTAITGRSTPTHESSTIRFVAFTGIDPAIPVDGGKP